jgi:hypothetical protein
MLFRKSPSQLRHKVDRAGLLDRVIDVAMKLGGNTCHAAWQDLSGLGAKLAEKLWIGWRQLLDRDVLPAAGHLAVRLAEINAALDGLWLGHKISGVRGEEFCA